MSDLWKSVKVILSERYGYKYLDDGDYKEFLKISQEYASADAIASVMAERISGGGEPLNDR